MNFAATIYFAIAEPEPHSYYFVPLIMFGLRTDRCTKTGLMP